VDYGVGAKKFHRLPYPRNKVKTKKKMMKNQSLLDFIGNTPLIKANNILVKKGVSLYLKLEGNNPGGSVKDRPALNMIRSAFERNDIKKGDYLIEATSGNTGIALAMIAQQYEINIELVMPENSTKERVQTMEAYGAKVTLTPASEGIEGSRTYAEKQVAEKGHYMLDQFANPDNWKAHYKTTGPEIWRDTDGEITHFVSAMGTTGTIIGTSTFLKEKNAAIQIVGAQPDDDSKIPGIRKWSPAFLPKIFDAKKVDQVIEVTESEARSMTKRLAKEEGVFAGMSSGGSVTAALKLAETLKKGVIVAIICDRGDRYLSSDLFE
jgi:cysteine synthase B